MTENSKQGAFATSTQLVGEEVFQQGLTKREYFAGLAMQGLLANVNGFYLNEKEKTSENAEIKAKFCIRMADELLKQLEQ